MDNPCDILNMQDKIKHLRTGTMNTSAKIGGVFAWAKTDIHLSGSGQSWKKNGRVTT